MLVQRSVFRVQLDAPHQRRLEALRKAHHALVFLFGVHPDLREVGVHLVAQHALHQVEVVIDQRRRLAALGAVLDLSPQMLQKADVGTQFVFLDVGRCRPHDEAAQAVFALAGHDALQTLALFFGIDLARHANVVHRRHVHQEPARQRDVAGDARALLGDWLLGDLDQDFLPFLQQVGDQRQRTVRMRANVVAASSAAAAAIVAAIETLALGLALLVSGRRSRGAQFSPPVDLFFAFVFFLFALVAGGESSLAALFGSDDFVFVDVGYLGNPAFRIPVAAVECFFFQLQFQVARYFAQLFDVLRHRVELHLIVFQGFVLQRASFRSLRRRAVLVQFDDGSRLLALDFLFAVLPQQLRQYRVP